MSAGEAARLEADVMRRRHLMPCDSRDPCAYDNTCRTHKALDKCEREWAAAFADLEREVAYWKMHAYDHGYQP